MGTAKIQPTTAENQISQPRIAALDEFPSKHGKDYFCAPGKNSVDLPLNADLEYRKKLCFGDAFVYQSPLTKQHNPKSTNFCRNTLNIVEVNL